MKTHLGDGVYAIFKDGYIVLTTENEEITDNTIYLDIDTVSALVKFLERVREEV